MMGVGMGMLGFVYSLFLVGLVTPRYRRFG